MGGGRERGAVKGELERGAGKGDIERGAGKGERESERNGVGCGIVKEHPAVI